MKHVCNKKYRLLTYLLLLSLFLLQCTRLTETETTVFPKHFLTSIPFQTDNRGILISTYWGTTGKAYKLYLDNHSPSWVNQAVLHNNTSVSKSKALVYSTTTADGTVLKGAVYVCDSIRIGGISFSSIPFYDISPKEAARGVDGVIGESIMEHGIWKIDFENSRITIASDRDSIKDLLAAKALPAVFTDKAIEIEICFSNNNKQKFGLDLGYNGDIILPLAAFTLAIAQDKKIAVEKRKFSTPGGSGIVDDRNVRERIRTGGLSVDARVSSNKVVKEKLIGLGFFRQFKFIVIDYINKAVYLSSRGNAR